MYMTDIVSETKDVLLDNRIPPWNKSNFKVTAEETLGTGRDRRSDGCLYAKGFRVAEIRKITTRLFEAMIPDEGLRMGGLPGSVEDDMIPLPNHLWRTLVADRGPDGGNPPIWYRRAMLLCLANRNANNDIHTKGLIDRRSSAAMLEYLHRVSNVIWNKRLMSSSGVCGTRFGLAPTDAEEKDIICILLGCSVPVVLREQGQGAERSYKFIGEAYVYGMMDGEALAKYAYLDQKGIEAKAEEFRLR